MISAASQLEGKKNPDVFTSGLNETMNPIYDFDCFEI